MELRMIEFKQPSEILFNYHELKTDLEAKVKMYETLVYTDDQITEAKKDKANLNKLKKALNDERIRLQKEYLEPFNHFKAQIDDLISVIEKPVGLIDKQVKEYEELQKSKKKEEIEASFNDLAFPEFVKFEMVFDERWLNASLSMKGIKETLEVFLEGVKKDLATIENLHEFAFEALEAYKTTLDINKAIQEGQRMAEIQKRKAEQTENHNIASDEPRTWVSFKAHLTIADAEALKQFFEARNIEFEAI